MSRNLYEYLEKNGYEYIEEVECYHVDTSYNYAVGPRLDRYTGNIRMSYGARVSALTRYTKFFTAEKKGKIDFCKCDYYIQDSDKEFFPANLEVLIPNSGNLVRKIYVTKNNGYTTDMVRFAMFEGNRNIKGYNFCESSIRSFKNIKFVDFYDKNTLLSLTNGKLVTFELDGLDDNGYSYDGKYAKIGNVYLKQKEVVYDKDEIAYCKKIDTEIDDDWWDIKDSLNENVYLIKNKDNKYRILGITRDKRLIASDLYDKLELTKKYILPPLTMENQDPESPYQYPDTGLVFNFKNSSDSGEFIIDDKLNQYHRNCNKLVLVKSVDIEEN